jgi:hypothetical protein
MIAFCDEAGIVTLLPIGLRFRFEDALQQNGVLGNQTFATRQGCRTLPARHQKACSVAAASSVVLASLRERLTRTSTCLPRYAPQVSTTAMTAVRTQQDSYDTEPKNLSRKPL